MKKLASLSICEVSQKQVLVTVVVEIDPGRTLAVGSAFATQSRDTGDFLKGRRFRDCGTAGSVVARST